MGYGETLEGLFPNGPWDATAPVLNTFLEAIGSQLDSQSAASTAMVNNNSPYTADINGIARWEKSLGLPSDPSLTLQQRRQKCIARSYRPVAPFTLPKLQGLFNAVSAGPVQIQVLPHLNRILAQFGMNDVSDYTGMLQFLYSTLPAHIELIPSFTTTVNTRVVASASPLIIVNRIIYANNGGPNRVGRVLDGTWPLDGTQQLSGSWQKGPTASSTATIIVTRNVPSAQYSDVRGIVLDGGRRLDGTWSLSGATTQMVTVGVQKTFVIPRTSVVMPTASCTEKITVTCYATGNNLPTLNGTWKLDGTKTLNGKVPGSVTVTINGSAA